MNKKIFFIVLLITFPLLNSCSQQDEIVSSICDITSEICYYSNLICQHFDEVQPTEEIKSKYENKLQNALTELKIIYAEKSNKTLYKTLRTDVDYKARLLQIKSELIKTVEELKKE